MRGERKSIALPMGRNVGSSPHARGTLSGARVRQSGARFIPACAGNASERRNRPGYLPVHPRMRGERRAPSPTTARCNGSSPHARGTPRDRRLHLGVDRFIPACAGNADASYGITGFNGGSSPHARGTPVPGSAHTLHTRFIPACAGNASPSETGQRTSSVHPRMRGERALTRQRDQQVIGSSPHARGTPNGISPSKRNHRFIPACAGNAA